MFTIQKDFAFSASHVLEGLPEGHQCGRLHGHNYVIRVQLEALRLDATGFVVDYAELKPFGAYLDATFDHRHLNDFFDVNPTAEHMALHMLDKLQELLVLPPHVTVVGLGVSETPKTWAWVQL